MDKVERLIVEFAGWIQCDPEETKFHYVGSKESLDSFFGGGDIQITGKEYMTLSEEERGNFVLECLGDSYINALDGECDHLTVEVEEVMQRGAQGVAKSIPDNDLRIIIILSKDNG